MKQHEEMSADELRARVQSIELAFQHWSAVRVRSRYELAESAIACMPTDVVNKHEGDYQAAVAALGALSLESDLIKQCLRRRVGT